MESDDSNSDEQDSDDDDNDGQGSNSTGASDASDNDDENGHPESEATNDSDDNSNSDDTENSDEDEDEEDSESAHSTNSRGNRSRRPLSSSSSTSAPSSGPLVCPIKGCTLKFTHRPSLTSHIREHTPEEANYRYPCIIPGCRFFSESRRGHATHSRTCGGDPSASFACQWPGCERLFPSANGLAQHRRRHMKSPGSKQHYISRSFAKKYRCHWPGCKKVTTRPKEFEEHLERHAEQQRRSLWPCREEGCNKTFETRSAMRAHQSRCKEGESTPAPQFLCPMDGCKGYFKSAAEALAHGLSHSRTRKDDKYRCDIPGCGAIMVSAWKLKRHKEWHEEHVLGIQWICLVKRCGKIAYPGTWNLLDHQARRHPELSPNHQFPCPYDACPAMFPDQKAAYVHDCRLTKKVCPVKGCDCVLPNEEVEEAHKLLHEILNAPPPYKCSEKNCLQEFKDQQEFFSHATGHIFEP
ncbi:hypothetical protein BGX23_003438 [Mortierella sp. AD031]|nr:hypothetical protein BGX23_003438 [Mortierella sp. AD031]